MFKVQVLSLINHTSNAQWSQTSPGYYIGLHIYIAFSLHKVLLDSHDLDHIKSN